MSAIICENKSLTQKRQTHPQHFPCEMEFRLRCLTRLFVLAPWGPGPLVCEAGRQGGGSEGTGFGSLRWSAVAAGRTTGRRLLSHGPEPGGPRPRCGQDGSPRLTPVPCRGRPSVGLCLIFSEGPQPRGSRATPEASLFVSGLSLLSPCPCGGGTGTRGMVGAWFGPSQPDGVCHTVEPQRQPQFGPRGNRSFRDTKRSRGF